MREVKYKAWNKEDHEWLDIESFGFMDNKLWYVITHDGEKYYIEKGYVEVVQYTGLKDKNGVEIYEGDIVQASHRIQGDDEIILLQEQVRFLNGCFIFGNWNAHEYFSSHRYIEVIGNIYENPELLKE